MTFSLKTCRGCGRTLARRRFYYSQYGDGRTARCIDCMKEAANRQRERQREKEYQELKRQHQEVMDGES